MSWRKARNAAFLLLAYAVALMPRLYVVRNPGAAVLYRDGATGLYNGDELMVLSAMLDRLLGVPSLGTMWPVVTLQMLSLPLWLVRALGGTHLPHGHAAILARLAQELATAVANPIASLTLMRTVNATTSAVAASLAAAIALRCGASRSFTLLTAAAVAVCPIFFLQSVMASGEGLMLTMELAALALLLPFYMEDEDGRHLGRCLAAGFCFSAAIASKYTAAPAVLLLGGVLLQWRRPWQSLLRLASFAVGATIGAMALIPWIWLEPLRLAKGVLGNLSKTGSASSLPQWLELHRQAYGVSGCVLVVAIVTAGVWALAVSHGRQKSWLAWSLLTLVAVNLPVYQHATSAYARYLVPEMLPLLALALGAHLQWQRTTAKHGLRIGTALVAALLLAGAGISLVGDMRYARSSDGMEEAFALRGKIAAENWYLPDDVLSLHKGMLNAAYLDGAWTRALQLEKSNDGLREWLTTHGLPLDSADVLERNFSEYEQSQAVHIRLLRHYALPGGGTQVVFGARNLPDAALGRNALLSLSYNDAQRSYLEKSSAAMLDRCQLHAEVPLLHANEWCWYQH